MKTVNDNINTFDELKDREFGIIGKQERDLYEKEAEAFIIGVMLKEARIAKGLTQEQLARKVGTTKAYISRKMYGYRLYATSWKKGLMGILIFLFSFNLETVL
jgi:ribosome-binding protein aMBF1 (putative translation factor)